MATWPSDICGKCKQSTPSLDKVTCAGCGRVGCRHCMGNPTQVAAASMCKFCVRELDGYKRVMGVGAQ